MKIFIVEDDEVIANKIKQHLVKWDYESLIAKDFQNILSALVSFDPQLVLLDITLPFLTVTIGVGNAENFQCADYFYLLGYR